jgi:hypothetical protein
VGGWVKKKAMRLLLLLAALCSVSQYPSMTGLAHPAEAQDVSVVGGRLGGWVGGTRRQQLHQFLCFFPSWVN